MEKTITRQQIIEALRNAFEPLKEAHAMWEGGAASFHRTDAWSDIDLQVDVDDEFAGQALAIAERTLETLSPIELKYVLPMPTWHGHSQVFFRLQDTSPFLLIDFVAVHHSKAEKFMQPEIHGEHNVLFDKDGTTRVPPLDRKAFAGRLEDRLHVIRTTFDLFQVLTLKELERGNLIEALVFYQNYTLRPLIEALRLRHCPAHYQFYTRYLYYDLPADAVARLEELFLPRSASDIRRLRSEAEMWFYRTLDEIELIGLPELVEQDLGTHV